MLEATTNRCIGFLISASSKIAVPTLLLYGSADVRSPLTVAEGLHTQIPGSRLVVMPGIGHLSNVDAPDLFNAEVRRFLNSVPG